jgi:hypothetical protein
MSHIHPELRIRRNRATASGLAGILMAADEY